MTGRTRRRRTRQAVIATVALVALGATAAAANGVGLPSADPTSTAHSKLPPATAKVTRQTLVDTQTNSGELGFGDTTTVNDRLAGTVTGLPATGSTIERGQPLYEVDNAPVVLLYGRLPTYRALSPGTKGADVEQFERNLEALGYTGFTVDETYSAATATAVKKWQKDLGLRPTGTVELGRVGYAAGPVRVDSDKAAIGDIAQPGQAMLTYTQSQRVVTVNLDVDSQQLARKGGSVNLELPTGKTVTGKITQTATVVTPAEGNTPATTKIKVTVAVADQRALTGLDQATIEVGFTASQRTDVLTVPVAALLALAEGGYGVQVVDGTSTSIIAVQTGLFASGRVEVSGGGLAEGMTVGMPS
jgi:peptidoglycan hydrolase-like protein with peptidoglycan-binding domain